MLFQWKDLCVSRFAPWKRVGRQTAQHFCIIYTLRIWKILRPSYHVPRWHPSTVTCHRRNVMPSCNSHGLSLPPPKATFLKLQLSNKKPVELLNVFLASSKRKAVGRCSETSDFCHFPSPPRRFRSGSSRVLISTDLWGRGLDVQQVPVGQNQTYTCGQRP